MEIGQLQNERLTGVAIRFYGLMAATWIGFALLRLPEHQAPARLLIALFALGAPILSTWFLHLLGYFHSARILPRQSDLALVAAAVPLAAVIQYGLMIVSFGRFPISLTDICASSMLVAVSIFGAHFVIEQRLMKNGAKRRIGLFITPAERTALQAEIDCHGLTNYIEFLDPEAVRKCFAHGNEDTIDRIVISRGAVRELTTGADLIRAHLMGIPIIDRRELSANLSGRIPLSNLDSWSFMVTATQQTPLLRAYAQFKVFLEPLFAVALAVVLAPIMVVIAILIRLDSKGPILYRQERIGYLGRRFHLFKFRSMRTDSEAAGPKWATQGDDRVTGIGRTLRALRLDELPQLWNVMRGEMCFIGPRPERPEFTTQISESVPLFPIRASMRPGITGWAQVCAGYAASLEESKTKLEFDLYYIKHVSPRLDLIILIKTFLIAFMGSERARTKPVMPKVE